MSNSSSEPRPNASTIFQLNLGGRIALAAFALALAASLAHGDYAPIPALLFLALITLVAFGVRAPASDSADADSLAYYRVRLDARQFGTRSRKTAGEVAYAYGACLPVEVLESAEGFYVGTRQGDLPFSRESVDYYPTRAIAQSALERGCWRQRRLPVQHGATLMVPSFQA